MATREELINALRKADAAGDEQGARILANAIRALPAEPAPVQSPILEPTQPAPESESRWNNPFSEEGRAGIAQTARDLIGGGLRGAGSIGATLLSPIDYATDVVKGDRKKNLTSLVTGQQPLSRNEERRRAIDEGLKSWGANPESTAYGAGKLAAEIAGTAGTGGVLGKGLLALAPNATKAAALLSSGGMGTGNLAAKIGAGAATGATSAGLIDP